MILIEIKKVLAEKKQMTLQQLSAHFNKDPQIMRMMVQHWIAKGNVIIAQKPAGCGSRCHQCKPEFAEIYHYKN